MKPEKLDFLRMYTADLLCCKADAACTLLPTEPANVRFRAQLTSIRMKLFNLAAPLHFPSFIGLNDSNSDAQINIRFTDASFTTLACAAELF